MSKETFYEEPRVLDTLVSFDQDSATNNLIIQRAQEIPDDWLMANRKQREDSLSQRAGEFEAVASIPVEVADWLLRTLNYDVTKEPFRRTIALLKAHHMDHFILTNRSL